MCSIYDNLRKGLGNVSKDRCIFIFLTLLSIFAGSYCCDIPALPGFEWFIHHSEFLKIFPIALWQRTFFIWYSM